MYVPLPEMWPNVDNFFYIEVDVALARLTLSWEAVRSLIALPSGHRYVRRDFDWPHVRVTIV